jgi:hypothetical protein
MQVVIEVEDDEGEPDSQDEDSPEDASSAGDNAEPIELEGDLSAAGSEASSDSDEELVDDAGMAAFDDAIQAVLANRNTKKDRQGKLNPLKIILSHA